MAAKIKIVVFLVVATLVGCSRNDSSESILQDKPKNDLPAVDVWIVIADGDFENGEQLLVMEHGMIEESGENWASNTYGLKITNGEREIYLLWNDSPDNPYGLRKGDRFRFTDTIKKRFFDEESNGYRASKQDVQIIPRLEGDNT